MDDHPDPAVPATTARWVAVGESQGPEVARVKSGGERLETSLRRLGNGARRARPPIPSARSCRTGTTEGLSPRLLQVSAERRQTFLFALNAVTRMTTGATTTLADFTETMRTCWHSRPAVAGVRSRLYHNHNNDGHWPDWWQRARRCLTGACSRAGLGKGEQ